MRLWGKMKINFKQDCNKVKCMEAVIFAKNKAKLI
jgi:hypothetical protein